jgi:hypothetical protein
MGFLYWRSRTRLAILVGVVLVASVAAVGELSPGTTNTAVGTPISTDPPVPPGPPQPIPPRAPLVEVSPTTAVPHSSTRIPHPVTTTPPRAVPAPPGTSSAAPRSSLRVPPILACNLRTHRLTDAGGCVLRSLAPISPLGASALCRDGAFSASTHRSGTCSGHRGVRQWLKDLP